MLTLTDMWPFRAQRSIGLTLYHQKLPEKELLPEIIAMKNVDETKHERLIGKLATSDNIKKNTTTSQAY
jgi:hypothetical protein